MPICPAHWDQACGPNGIFVHGHAVSCPLCDRDTYGDYLLCGYCASEAEACVFDAKPLDGSSGEPPAWLGGLRAERQAAQDAIPRVSAEEVERRERARGLIGVWRTAVATGPSAVQERYLVLGQPDFVGLLASVSRGRLAELSRFRWSYEGVVLAATPLPLAALPPGTWERPLALSPTRVEVSVARSDDGAVGQRRLSFPDQPPELLATGCHFARTDPPFALREQLDAVLRAEG